MLKAFWNDQLETLRCLQRMPLWVQVWTAAILIPANLAGVFFLGEPFAIPILILANTAMLIVGLMIPRMRGVSRIMSAPHVVYRILLLGFLSALLAGGLQASPGYIAYLWVPFAVNAVALAMDAWSCWCWLRGDRAIL